ncbi:MAG TPA: hypothetical protein PKC28_16775, partial [Bdellovibrionales bacterium]|nr:hypothetical protein [Bdellovibrionales bacterium]
MASKSTKNFWGLKHGSLLAGYLASRPEKGRNAHVIVQMNTKTPKAWRDFFVDVKAPGIVRLFDAKHEAWVLVCPMATADQETDPKLRAKPWARIRDAMGPVIAQIEKADVASAVVDLDIDKALLPAAIAGLEIALYRFKRVLKSETPKFHMVLRHKGKVLTPAAVEPMTALGQSVNVARHLVNLAPNDLNPVSYADFAHKFLSGVKGLKVDVWDEKRLRAERMGLLLAVGRGAATPPRLVHVKYRGDGPRAPVAIVGKGITFDTGGVDI